MSPPEVWGPAVWTLFHTLIEKLNPNYYPYIVESLFGIIVRICRYLPCPECSRDASNFLARLKLKDFKTKDDFRNMMYLFHNWVNAKKRKPLFNYVNLSKYSNLNLISVINNFIAKYNTKGNMRLLAESFQRTFVVKDLMAWFKANSRVFIQPTETKTQIEKEITPATKEEVIENVDDNKVFKPTITPTEKKNETNFL